MTGDPGPTRAALLAAATRDLARAGVPGAARDARLLLRWAGGHDAARLATLLDQPASPDESARLAAATAARARRVPLSHLTGTREFWGRSFAVTADVLDPRPETECLIALALAGPPAARLLDLGTGTGCILLTLLAEWPGASGLGRDISPAALAVARGNADRLGLAARARFDTGDWLAGLTGPFDLVVANPPYLAADELGSLAPELAFEPHIALSPGGDGLAAYRAIAAGVAPVLAPGGRVLVEIGPTQGTAVMALLQAAGLTQVALHPDLDGRDRVVSARG